MAQKQMSNQYEVKRGRHIAKLWRANWERSGPVMFKLRQLLEEMCARALETDPPRIFPTPSLSARRDADRGGIVAGIRRLC